MCPTSELLVFLSDLRYVSLRIIMSCESYCRAASNLGLQQGLQEAAFMASYLKYALQLLSDSKDANLHSIIHRAIDSQYQYVIGNQNAV